MSKINLSSYIEIESRYVSDIGSECTILEHVKTKAKVLVISNDDENKVFSIAFRTPPTDSTGLPHILEHSVLCGSRKFPVKDPFVELMKSSLNTFLNAFTSPDKTMYPVASCNDKDFANLMDVYLDATLYPNIYKYEEIFRQEGWHYELENSESDIVINGVVYNEMKGAYSNPDQVLFRESLAALLPDTCYGVSSGGNPDNIPELSYEDFINFHKRYYHPSNSYIVLYGNMDVNERLDWMDKAYLSNFEAIEIDSSIALQKPFEEMKFVDIAYPVSQKDTLENKTMFSYNFTVGDVDDPLLWMSNNILSYILLDAPGALLKDALVKSGVAPAISGGYQDGLNQPMFMVIAKGTNKDSKEKFIEVVEATLKEIVKNGIDKKTLLATVNGLEFQYRESDFGRMPKGLVYAMNSFNTWLYDYNPLLTLEVGKLFDEIRKLVETDYFEKIIEKYYINNNHKALVTIYPDKEIQEVKNQALKQKLQKMKDEMTSEEVNQLIQKTKDLKAYSMTPSSKEDLRSLPTLERSDIKKDVIAYSNIEREYSNVKVLQHDFFTNGIGYLKVMFDISKIDEEYLPYLSLLASSLGSISTEKYDYRQLDNEVNIKTGGIRFDVSTANTSQQGDYKLVAGVNMKVLYEKIGEGIDLILEIIQNAKFNDHKRLKEIVNEQSTQLKNKLISMGHVISLGRALSYIDERYSINDNLSGINYYEFISRLAENFDQRAEEVSNTLSKLCKNVFRKDNMLISYTANNEGYKYLEESLDKFFVLPLTTDISYNYNFKKDPKNEGFKTSSNVQYVARCGNFVQNGFEYSGALQVFKKILSTEYLWMKVRVDGGAYGCMCHFNPTGPTYFVSYRDPNIEKTNNVYNDILKFIDEFNPSEEDMTKFIIGTFGEIDAPLSPAGLGNESLISYLIKRSVEETRKRREEMINCTVNDIKNLKPLIKSVLDENVICVIGNENKIEEAKHLFSNISYLGK